MCSGIITGSIGEMKLVERDKIIWTYPGRLHGQKHRQTMRQHHALFASIQYMNS